MSSDFFELEVNTNDTEVGKRLDLYLALKLPDYSRSAIKRTVESNQVFVNGVINFKAGYKVQFGDKIKFPKIPVSGAFKELEPSPFDLEIISEDDDYLFINKPISISVHPANSFDKHTLVNKLISKYKDLPGNNLSRPGIVHRLDKDTSGVIAIAKTPKALWWLSGQFAERKVSKKYVSIGMSDSKPATIFEGAEFEVNGYMRRSSDNQKQFVLTKTSTSNARYSLSKFKVLKVKDIDDISLALFEISPRTGRTHQIRVHQKSFNMPIIGDKLYLSTKQKNFSDKFLTSNRSINRLFLHANTLSFENYDGKRYSITSDLPKEFNQLMS